MALSARTREARRRHLVDSATGLIRDGQERGLFATDLDPARAARWIVALTDGGYLMSDDEDFDTDADRAEVRRIVTAYLSVSR